MRSDRDALIAHYSFPLDGFQVRALDALDDGESVLVAAPTGSGKTVVAEYAIDAAVADGKRAFYTAPIKALSNQKYHDLVRVHGADKVGLLTGDSSVNGEAPVVVMTTEVLRNMLYAGSSTLHSLGYVVMDEVHYLADRFRGAVWEEVIIHLPESVTVVALSATVSNSSTSWTVQQNLLVETSTSGSGLARWEIFRDGNKDGIYTEVAHGTGPLIDLTGVVTATNAVVASL